MKQKCGYSQITCNGCEAHLHDTEWVLQGIKSIGSLSSCHRFKLYLAYMPSLEFDLYLYSPKLDGISL